jgi:cytoskeletal protein RodZ
MVQVTGQAAVMQREAKAKLQSATTVQAAAPAAMAGAGRGGRGGAPAEARMQQVGQKVFFKQGPVWQDSSVTADQAAHATHVVQFSQQYFDLAASHGGVLAQYLALDEPVLVNLGAQTYRIDPEK